jgi:hypothetical protein
MPMPLDQKRKPKGSPADSWAQVIQGTEALAGAIHYSLLLFSRPASAHILAYLYVDEVALPQEFLGGLSTMHHSSSSPIVLLSSKSCSIQQAQNISEL